MRKQIVIIPMGIILYAALFAGIRFLTDLLPRFYLWERIEYSISICGYTIRWIDIVYFVLGLIIFVHALTDLFGISRQNHTVQDMATRQPTRLLTTGYYAKVRHPMYGTFMLMELGLFFPSRSVYGLIIIVFVVATQALNGRMEEKRQLEVLFEDTYGTYKENVPVRYLTPTMKTYFIICIVFSILGLIWM